MVLKEILLAPGALSGQGEAPMENIKDIPVLAENTETISFEDAKKLFIDEKSKEIVSEFNKYKPVNKITDGKNPGDSLKNQEGLENNPGEIFLNTVDSLINAYGIENFKSYINSIDPKQLESVRSFIKNYSEKNSKGETIFQGKFPIELNLNIGDITVVKRGASIPEKIGDKLILGQCSIEPMIHKFIEYGNEWIAEDTKHHYVRIPMLFVVNTNNGIKLVYEQDLGVISQTMFEGKYTTHLNDKRVEYPILSIFSEKGHTFLDYSVEAIGEAVDPVETSGSIKYHEQFLDNAAKLNQGRDEIYAHAKEQIYKFHISTKAKKDYLKILKKTYKNKSLSNEILAQKSQELIMAASNLVLVEKSYDTFKEYSKDHALPKFTETEKNYIAGIQSTNLPRMLMGASREDRKDFAKIYSKIFKQRDVSKYNKDGLKPIDLIQNSGVNKLLAMIEEDISNLQLVKGHPKLQKKEDQKKIDDLINELLWIQKTVSHIKTPITRHKKAVRMFFKDQEFGS